MNHVSGGQLTLNLDIACQRAAQQFVHAADQGIQIDDLRLEHLLARERQQSLDQLAAAHGRVERGLGLS